MFKFLILAVIVLELAIAAVWAFFRFRRFQIWAVFWIAVCAIRFKIESLMSYDDLHAHGAGTGLFIGSVMLAHFVATAWARWFHGIILVGFPTLVKTPVYEPAPTGRRGRSFSRRSRPDAAPKPRREPLLRPQSEWLTAGDEHSRSR